MDVLGRYRNLIVLVGVLFAQVLGLAVQVRRTTDSEPTRLIRVWAVGAVTPLEKALVWVQTSTGNIWHNYFYLRGVRAENRSLKQQIERMSLEQVRMSQDADQARRLQALLAFKEQFISQTMAAQVIGSSGSESSRSVYIDKGEHDGIKPDMAVITADGIVGKVLRVYRSTSQVLLIDDQTSGVGAILDKTRVQGIVRGTPSGEVELEKVMSDETVPAGEQVLTSGGDGIFPKGLMVGRVTKVSPGSELFLKIHVHPAANLSRLEEVLVVTKIDERQAEPDQTGSVRAVDILAGRLPGVPTKPENSEKQDSAGAAGANSETKPATGPPQASANGEKPAEKPAVKPPKAVPSSETGAASASGIPASHAATTSANTMKASPKPVNAVVEPKPQPAVKQDSPH
jgi:rod shape-determining protein MreC